MLQPVSKLSYTVGDYRGTYILCIVNCYQHAIATAFLKYWKDIQQETDELSLWPNLRVANDSEISYTMQDCSYMQWWSQKSLGRYLTGYAPKKQGSPNVTKSCKLALKSYLKSLESPELQNLKSIKLVAILTVKSFPFTCSVEVILKCSHSLWR